MSRYSGPLLIADLETTGLDPDSNHVLEFGAVLTTGVELTVRGEASLVIRPPGGTTEHDKMYAAMPPEVREMHRANGLWEEATTGDGAWNIHDADMALCEWLDGKLRECEHDGLVALAGSGVERFDRPWINRHFPKLAQRFFYRAVDVSPQRMTMDYCGRLDLCDPLMVDSDTRPHRALLDCRLEVDEIRGYMHLYQSFPRRGEVVLSAAERDAAIRCMEVVDDKAADEAAVHGRLLLAQDEDPNYETPAQSKAFVAEL